MRELDSSSAVSPERWEGWPAATCKTHERYGVWDGDVTLPAWFSLASKGHTF
jgi:hypothetical protein